MIMAFLYSLAWVGQAPMSEALKLGTRGSPLALVQARMVADALARVQDRPVEIVTVRTSGDRIQDRALADIGGKALWTKELDGKLIGGDIDFAVHSMKDVETIRPVAIVIAAMLPRAPVQDRLVGAESVLALKQGAIVGTSSPRRAAQIRRIRPDLVPVLFRGNVATRLAKLAAGEADATLLAAAGLIRLGHADVGTDIPVETMLPAPAQGAVGIECRSGDDAMRALLALISDRDTMDCVLAERALLAALGAGCHSPVAALARIVRGKIHLEAEILLADGAEHVTASASFARGDAAVPAEVARTLLAGASSELAALFQP
jgi:hydroxymethylbilane synthase